MTFPLRASLLLASMSIASLGCGATPSEQLRAKAATDLACDRDKVSLTALDPEPFVSGDAADWSKTVSVAACGKKVTYYRERGEWVRNQDGPASTDGPVSPDGEK